MHVNLALNVWVCDVLTIYTIYGLNFGVVALITIRLVCSIKVRVKYVLITSMWRHKPSQGQISNLQAVDVWGLGRSHENISITYVPINKLNKLPPCSVYEFYELLL